jgi:hypothetical protein
MREMTEQPFWIDEPKTQVKYQLYWQLYMLVIGYALYAWITILILVVTYFFISKIVGNVLASIFFAIIALAWITGLLRRRRVRVEQQDITDLQQRARQQTGASCIGSAVHVAGHPSLQREQPVVLALVRDQLQFYAYEAPVPLDSLFLKDIQALHTVVYDEDRIPHIDVIDSTAQALQIEFLWRQQPCSCLFRRMRGVRPIDWFHALQQASLQLTSA